MDPDAALLTLVRAACDGHNLGMLDAARDLADWLERGGFAPTLDALLSALTPFGGDHA